MAGFNELINSDRPVLIDFYADWCGPCKIVAPYIQEVKQKLGQRASVLKIDVDKNPVLATKLGVQGVPTLIIYQNGQQKWRQSGVVPPDVMVQELEKLLT